MDDSHEGKTTKYRVIDEQGESKRTNHAMTELRICQDWVRLGTVN